MKPHVLGLKWITTSCKSFQYQVLIQVVFPLYPWKDNQACISLLNTALLCCFALICFIFSSMYQFMQLLDDQIQISCFQVPRLARKLFSLTGLNESYTELSDSYCINEWVYRRIQHHQKSKKRGNDLSSLRRDFSIRRNKNSHLNSYWSREKKKCQKYYDSRVKGFPILQ